MFRKNGVQLVVAALGLLFLAVVAYSSPPAPVSDEQMAARVSSRPVGGHLDQDYNQLRYVKTTDFGASWTMAQAGDLSTFAPYDNEAFGDFSAVTMSNGELCYLVTLLNAATPGVYALAGPSFTPVSVMAQGSNDLSFGYFAGGHTDISRAPDGSLVGIIWGGDALGASTVWACKSNDNGATWSSWLIAAEPNIPTYDPASYDGLYRLPDRVGSQWAWALYQDPTDVGFEMKTIRFDHTTTNAGTIVPLGDYAGHPFSFMFSGCKPIAYDPAANYLFATFRNHDASGILIRYSSDAGLTWQQAVEITDSRHRYPSVSVNVAAQTPYLVYGQTVGGLNPGDEQCMFMSYDELFYGGGSWIDPPTDYQCVTLFDENTGGYNSLYVPEVWWWDATHGVSSYNGYTNFLSGEIIETSRTTDGGVSWIDMGTRMHYVADQFNAGTMQICELVGGEAGVAYVIFSASPGITDEQAPSVGPMELLTSPTDPDGPYVVRAYYSDNVGIDVSSPATSGPWVNWGDASGVTVAYVNQDSQQVDANNVGWYYFTIPDTALGGISQGDSIFFYCDGYDLSGIYAASLEQIIVAGVEWLDAFRPSNGRVTEYALSQNYPNPFNPTTAISFNLPKDELVSLRLYNTLGQEVQTLVSNDMMGAGTHQITFSAADMPSGVYLYRLTAGSFSETRKMMLVK